MTKRKEPLPVLDFKKCVKCWVERPRGCFDKTSKTGVRSVCKVCRGNARKLMDTRHGDGLRASSLRKKYGMTPEDYYALSKAQNDVCLICELPNKFGPWKDKLVVDHCHKTGKIRGLLCDKCNKGLGQFDDDPERLLKAREYLTLS